MAIEYAWSDYQLSEWVEWSASRFKEDDIFTGKVREIYPSRLVIETFEPKRYRVTIHKSKKATVRKRKDV